MLRIGGESFAALAVKVQWEKTRRLLASNSRAFAALSHSDQDLWLAMASEDFARSRFHSEEALPTLAYALWYTGLSSVMDDPEFRAILRLGTHSEAHRLNALRDAVQRRLAEATSKAGDGPLAR